MPTRKIIWDQYSAEEDAYAQWAEKVAQDAMTSPRLLDTLGLGDLAEDDLEREVIAEAALQQAVDGYINPDISPAIESAWEKFEEEVNEVLAAAVNIPNAFLVVRTRSGEFMKALHFPTNLREIMGVLPGPYSPKSVVVRIWGLDDFDMEIDVDDDYIVDFVSKETDSYPALAREAVENTDSVYLAELIATDLMDTYDVTFGGEASDFTPEMVRKAKSDTVDYFVNVALDSWLIPRNREGDVGLAVDMQDGVPEIEGVEGAGPPPREVRSAFYEVVQDAVQG